MYFEVMAFKRHSTILRASEQEPQHQMQFCGNLYLPNLTNWLMISVERMQLFQPSDRLFKTFLVIYFLFRSCTTVFFPWFFYLPSFSLLYYLPFLLWPQFGSFIFVHCYFLFLLFPLLLLWQHHSVNVSWLPVIRKFFLSISWWMCLSINRDWSMSCH